MKRTTAAGNTAVLMNPRSRHYSRRQWKLRRATKVIGWNLLVGGISTSSIAGANSPINEVFVISGFVAIVLGGGLLFAHE